MSLSSDFLDKLTLLIVAPYPGNGLVKEGWMSRILMVDKILVPFHRMYLNFAKHHHVIQYKRHSEYVYEVFLDHTNPEHASVVENYINLTKLTYVHTCHLAEYIEPWLSTGKFIVDMHGIVPEEEAMLGRQELVSKYSMLEQKVLECSAMVVVVTRAMQSHFEGKYPQIKCNYMVMPIVEKYEGDRFLKADDIELPVKVLYAGGRQVWQNIDSSLRLANATKDFAEFSFYSHEAAKIKDRAEELGLSIDAGYDYCTKAQLPEVYGHHHFGLVLRDDSPVNRVSCPTKLSEYLDFGLIPIVRYPHLGDFSENGYMYVTENDFNDGFFPDLASRAWMIEVNHAVIDKIRKQFFQSAKLLRDRVADE